MYRASDRTSDRTSDRDRTNQLDILCRYITDGDGDTVP
jgi:hypothetical protein